MLGTGSAISIGKNPKSQAPNPKQYQNTKYQCSKHLKFWYLDLFEGCKVIA
jgi:hypothetical protein